MNELMNEIFLHFVDITGIDNYAAPVFSIGGMLIMVLGLVGCTLGFRTYRMFFSAILFFVTTVISFLVLEGESLRSIATCVAVVGVVLAFFGYRWPKVGGFVVCLMIGMSFGWLIYPNIIVAIIFGTLAALFEVFFPVLAISALTSLWGASLLIGGLEINGVLTAILILLVAAGNTMFQLLINQNQKLFSKVCPDKVTYWMEQRGK